MNGIHDMGGMHGFGPIEVEQDEPVFHAKWEARVYGMRLQLPGALRPVIERMNPTHYLASSYYEKWLLAMIQNLYASGAITQGELHEQIAYHRANPQAELPQRFDPQATTRYLAAIRAPVTHRHETDVLPIFRIGDRVQAKNIHPAGHTRLPRYVRGKRCVIVNTYGVQDFDDGLPGEKADPQPLYNVRFDAQELWGDDAEPNNALYLDMWESYLELP